MTDAILANYPALTVFNPQAVGTCPDIKLDVDKGYCRVSSGMITIRCFPRDRYEFIRNFYFGEADGEYFCNPNPAMLTSSQQGQTATLGYDLGDTVTVDGKNFKLVAAPNKNIKLEEV